MASTVQDVGDQRWRVGVEEMVLDFLVKFAGMHCHMLQARIAADPVSVSTPPARFAMISVAVPMFISLACLTLDSFWGVEEPN